MTLNVPNGKQLAVQLTNSIQEGRPEIILHHHKYTPRREIANWRISGLRITDSSDCIPFVAPLRLILSHVFFLLRVFVLSPNIYQAKRL